MDGRRISVVRGVQAIALLLAFTSTTYSEQLRYSNEWAVRLQGGVEAAQILAQSKGYIFAGQIPGFPHTYLLIKPDQPRHQKRAYLTKRLTSDNRVEWAEQQFYKLRQKRDFVDEGPPGAVRRNASTTEDRAPWRQEGVFRRRRRGDVDPPSPPLFNDELWEKQWYLQDTRTRPDLPPLDLQVLPVYARGYTGRDVRVTVLDDGVEHTHEDLRDNYDPAISVDVKNNNPDPSPRYDALHSNAHGTRCAGEIAMKANNLKCGVGVAFNARIGGVRLLDGDVNDRMEGTALGWARDLVDIYSASWGPKDDGATVEGPDRLAQEALRRGVTEGRGGRGSIFVWASGNGGTFRDNCNCDGYVNSIYTLAVGSASERGHFPWYGERCASTMAAAYSSGAYRDQMIATTDLRNSCTVRHTGTSAAAPLAAGIIALALEANPELSWRDMQHLVAVSAEATPLAENPGWRKNAAGFWANTRFGFGLLNADRLVRAAEKWLPVPPKTECECGAVPMRNTTLLRGERGRVFIEFECDACAGTPQEVNYLEHVQVLSNIEYPVRGALQVYLTSPGETKVQLLSPRKNDKSERGFVNWTFMSVLTWGEVPKGKWVLEIVDKSEGPPRNGSVGQFCLTLHGTAELPAYRLELNTTDLPSRPVYGNSKILVHDMDNTIGRQPILVDAFDNTFDNTISQHLQLGKIPDPDADLAEDALPLPAQGSPLVKMMNSLRGGA